jgi:hypothetical protein
VKLRAQKAMALGTVFLFIMSRAPIARVETAGPERN